jgi:diamine N-acetyltransferase
MIKILEFIHTFPAGPAQICWISYRADNLPTKKLYESFGFRVNGEILGDELITVLPLGGECTR